MTHLVAPLRIFDMATVAQLATLVNPDQLLSVAGDVRTHLTYDIGGKLHSSAIGLLP